MVNRSSSLSLGPRLGVEAQTVIHNPKLPVEPVEDAAMSRPRVRFTVRGMMIAVAVVSILLGGIIL